MATRSRFDFAQIGSELEIARRSLDDSIADHLRALIIRGELAPGEKLNLTELAQSLDVSTTPLRQALKTLTEEQIVEWAPGRAPCVAPIRVEETSELFMVIASLESLAAERAALQSAAEDLAELEDLHARMSVHFHKRERGPYFNLNSQIHARILNLSRNRVLQETHARLHARASRGRYLAIIEDSRWAEAMQEHEELMQALRDRDPSGAASIWRRHLTNTGAAVKRLQLEELP